MGALTLASRSSSPWRCFELRGISNLAEKNKTVDSTSENVSKNGIRLRPGISDSRHRQWKERSTCEIWKCSQNVRNFVGDRRLSVFRGSLYAHSYLGVQQPPRQEHEPRPSKISVRETTPQSPSKEDHRQAHFVFVRAPGGGYTVNGGWPEGAHPKLARDST